MKDRTMSTEQHWKNVYATKDSTAVSWYAPHLARSLQLIETVAPDHEARIIDVGGGASTLVDDLLDRGYHDVTVLDLSEEALKTARVRVGAPGSGVTWLAADVTTAVFPEAHYDVWHDRAVFHFLTDPEQRRRYVAQVMRAVKPGGHVIVATFGLEGPERCSGLDVVRYDADGLRAEFGAPFQKIGDARETHTTPWGSEQEFVYCYCLKLV
jgi:2-polyprenyl-3-methyl-5-hydroxy-6-metoxy-1,4-benzoquinol methylase